MEEIEDGSISLIDDPIIFPEYDKLRIPGMVPCHKPIYNA